MAEQIDLTVPEVIPALSTTAYKVALLWLDVENAIVVLHLRGSNGELKELRREGAVATALLKALNNSNNTVKSLQRRALEWAVTQGVLAGTVSGVPDA